jgi:hypothetical protein
VVTNLLAGMMGARWGIKSTLLTGLTLQLAGIGMLFGWKVRGLHIQRPSCNRPLWIFSLCKLPGGSPRQQAKVKVVVVGCNPYAAQPCRTPGARRRPSST